LPELNRNDRRVPVSTLSLLTRRVMSVTAYEQPEEQPQEDSAIRKRIWKEVFGDAPMPPLERGIILKHSGYLDKFVPADSSFSETLDELYD
jgi:hypothetical protein